MPIATGEKLFTIADFKPLIDSRACAVLQPDVTHCFGITTLVDIAKLAAAEQMLMAPHNAGGPPLLRCDPPRRCGHEQLSDSGEQQPTVTVLIAVSNTTVDDKGWTRQCFGAEPGLGVSVKESDLDDLPYEPLPYRQYRHTDGSWKGW